LRVQIDYWHGNLIFIIAITQIHIFKLHDYFPLYILLHFNVTFYRHNTFYIGQHAENICVSITNHYTPDEL